MYLCICTYILYTILYIYTHTCVYIYIYIHISISLSLYIYICIASSIHICTCVYCKGLAAGAADPDNLQSGSRCDWRTWMTRRSFHQVQAKLTHVRYLGQEVSSLDELSMTWRRSHQLQAKLTHVRYVGQEVICGYIYIYIYVYVYICRDMYRYTCVKLPCGFPWGSLGPLRRCLSAQETGELVQTCGPRLS